MNWPLLIPFIIFTLLAVFSVAVYVRSGNHDTQATIGWVIWVSLTGVLDFGSSLLGATKVISGPVFVVAVWGSSVVVYLLMKRGIDALLSPSSVWLDNGHRLRLRVFHSGDTFFVTASPSVYNQMTRDQIEEFDRKARVLVVKHKSWPKGQLPELVDGTMPWQLKFEAR